MNRQIGLDNIVQLTAKWGFLAKGSLLPGRLETLHPLVKKAPIFVAKDGVSLFYLGMWPLCARGGLDLCCWGSNTRWQYTSRMPRPKTRQDTTPATTPSTTWTPPLFSGH